MSDARGHSNQSSSARSQRGASAPSDPLDRLRSMRVRADRSRDLGQDLTRQMKSVKKISRAESAAIDAWGVAVPDRLAGFTRVAGLRAGKLVVLVPGAAQRHLVDRWLKSGGWGELTALARVPIRGVELKIAHDSTQD